MRSAVLALALGATFAVQSAPEACDACGTVLGVREIPRPGATTGSGMAAGIAIGSIVGYHAAGRVYRIPGTLLGSAGGAMAGHVYELDNLAVKSYEIGVRFDDGSLRLFTLEALPALKRDDRVRILNGALEPIPQSATETKP